MSDESRVLRFYYQVPEGEDSDRLEEAMIDACAATAAVEATNPRWTTARRSGQRPPARPTP